MMCMMMMLATTIDNNDNCDDDDCDDFDDDDEDGPVRSSFINRGVADGCPSKLRPERDSIVLCELFDTLPSRRFVSRH